jgi:hypothetical protein
VNLLCSLNILDHTHMSATATLLSTFIFHLISIHAPWT